jgi:hypothetical protein
MKKIISALLLSLVLFSCTDTKKQEKDLFDQVIKVHDRVMGKEELIMNSKMQLDTLLKHNQNAEVTGKANALTKSLDSADTQMENWMHNFDAENKGKSHDEIMRYLNGQKKEIDSIDSNFNAVLTAASTFIKQNKSK